APRNTAAPPYAFSEAWRNLSGPMWSKNQILGASRAASRRSARSPGKRACREDRAPSHRPQMSSGRLILDRVARQHSPSPLHRHEQNNTHSSQPPGKGDISTLLGERHFYFALTSPDLDLRTAFNCDSFPSTRVSVRRAHAFCADPHRFGLTFQRRLGANV